MIFGNFRKQLVFRKHATAGIPVHNSQLADELVVFFGRRSPASWGNGDHGRIGKVKTFSNHENEMRWSPWSVPIKSFVGQLFDKRSWRLRLRLRGDQPSPPRDLFFFLFFFLNPEPRCILFHIEYGLLHLSCTYLRYHVVVIPGQHGDATKGYLTLVPDWLTDAKKKTQFMSWWASTKYWFWRKVGQSINRH